MKDFEKLEFRDVFFQVLITDLRVRNEGKEDTIIVRGIDNVGAILGSVSVEHNLCIIVQIDEPISKGALKEKLNDWTKILEQRTNVWSAKFARLPLPEDYAGEIYYLEDANGNMKRDRFEIKLRVVCNMEE